MGIPKFFRYISERWPMISQLIDESQIPEFDNLYLDMNSILHTCTHANDDDVTKRVSEEEVFAKIFSYIDHLFHTIKPKQTFYMAIDGVAPRAKMNQQRARRFRTAIDAEKNLQKAIDNGEEIPKGEAFDSNAITPGTEFMAKLTHNLKYFIHDKISNDSLWADVNIIFSGHEVPGEGEHKIMDYIRNMRAQKDYNPNTRHCIYGLDADLIMLGLSTHDPHFALLREEVTFGRRQKAKPLEQQNFFLLHLSVLREYLELEFQEISDDLQFEYDFERILDDFLLVMFVIGNDFLPNLPDLHLNKGAFPVLLQTFKEALRHMDGYINEQGTINFQRFSVWLKYLSEFELMNFEKDDVDVEWFNQQLENISIQGERKRARIGKKLLLKQQKKIVGMIKPWLLKTISTKFPANITEDQIPTLPLEGEVVIENLDFLKELAFNLGLFIVHHNAKDTYSLKFDIDGINPNESEEQHEERIQSIRRSIKKYEQAVLVEDKEELEEEQEIYNERFERWKNEYYVDKLGFDYKDEDELKEMTENYVEGLQWVLYYYYRGCQSWSWYYKYHYAPRISDIKKGLDKKIEFNKGRPFAPFQQLMAVLPERSKNLIPPAYRPLMSDEKSPILDFYPHEVELDKNGKTADWEAVVKLSFVDEKRLIEAMAPYDAKLSPEEKKRNSFGTDLVFIFNPQVDNVYKTPLSGIFSDIEHNHCVEREFVPKSMDGLELLFGLPKGAKLGVEALAGFPTLKSIPFDNSLQYNECVVFQQPSRQQSMLLYIKDIFKEGNLTLDEVAKRHVGNIIYTRWPYSRESKLLSITDGQTIYEGAQTTNAKGKSYIKINSRPVDDVERKEFRSLKANMIRNYSKQKGVVLDDVRAIVKVVPVNGLARDADGSYLKTFSSHEEFYPLQLVVEDVENKDERFMEKPPLPIDQEYPQDSHVIFLGDYAYGGEAVVDGYSSSTRLKLTVVKRSMKAEPKIGKVRARIDQSSVRYYPSYIIAKRLQIHPLFLSKLTSKFLITDTNNRQTNVGLMIKFEARHEKVLGYSRRNVKGWEYSDMAMSLIMEYRQAFPDFFAKLSKLGNSIPNIQDLYPDVESSKLKVLLQNVSSWLKNVRQPFVTVSLESDSLTKVSIAAVEDEIERNVQQPDVSEKKQLAKVPREAVLDPKVSFALLRTQTFELGDRVIYVQDSGKVPLFSKGTVVGYTSLGKTVSIQVLFDNEIVAGNNFGGRLRTKRGLGLDSSFLLNITNRQFIYHSKASKKAKETSAVNNKNSKKNVQTRLLQKKKVDELKKKQAHELLTVIKKGEDESDEELPPNDEVEEGEEDRDTKANKKNVPKKHLNKKFSDAHVSSHSEIAVNADKNVASNVYNAVFNQFNANGQPIPQPPQPFGLPYAIPPGAVPPPGMFPAGAAHLHAGMPLPPHPMYSMAAPPMGVPMPPPPHQMMDGMISHPSVDEESSRELKSLIQGHDIRQSEGYQSNGSSKASHQGYSSDAKRGGVYSRGGREGSHRGSNASRGRGNPRGRGGRGKPKQSVPPKKETSE